MNIIIRIVNDACAHKLREVLAYARVLREKGLTVVVEEV